MWAVNPSEDPDVQQETVAGLAAVGRWHDVKPHNVAQVIDAVGERLRRPRHVDGAELSALQPESQIVAGGADVPAHDGVAVIDAVGHRLPRVGNVDGRVSE